MRATLASVVVVVALAVAVGGCSSADRAGTGPHTMPGCDPDQRLAIVAQSVPGAAYVPCVRALPPGWSFTGIEVALDPSCETGEATAIAPSDEGVRTYQLLDSISPRYAGRFLDVFPGGCVVATYDFERGAHLALVTELREAVDLYSRRELRQGLREALDITLDP